MKSFLVSDMRMWGKENVTWLMDEPQLCRYKYCRQQGLWLADEWQHFNSVQVRVRVREHSVVCVIFGDLCRGWSTKYFCLLKCSPCQIRWLKSHKFLPCRDRETWQTTRCPWSVFICSSRRAWRHQQVTAWHWWGLHS